jgi:hypothetical protein
LNDDTVAIDHGDAAADEPCQYQAVSLGDFVQFRLRAGERALGRVCELFQSDSCAQGFARVQLCVYYDLLPVEARDAAGSTKGLNLDGQVLTDRGLLVPLQNIVQIQKWNNLCNTIQAVYVHANKQLIRLYERPSHAIHTPFGKDVIAELQGRQPTECAEAIARDLERFQDWLLAAPKRKWLTTMGRLVWDKYIQPHLFGFANEQAAARVRACILTEDRQILPGAVLIGLELGSGMRGTCELCDQSKQLLVRKIITGPVDQQPLRVDATCSEQLMLAFNMLQGVDAWGKQLAQLHKNNATRNEMNKQLLRMYRQFDQQTDKLERVWHVKMKRRQQGGGSSSGVTTHGMPGSWLPSANFSWEKQSVSQLFGAK